MESTEVGEACKAAGTAKRQDEKQAEATPVAPGTAVWVTWGTEKRQAVVVDVGDWMGMPVVNVEYENGLVMKHPRDKVRKRAVRR